MSKKILVYIDHFNGTAIQASWEAIGVGQMLGGEISALAIGMSAKELATQAFQFGVQAAYFAEGESLVDYRPEPYTSILTGLVKEFPPDVIIFPTTIRGRELAAMSAVDLNSGVLADVTELSQQGEAITATRPVYGGKLLAKVTCQARPQIITTRVRAFAKPAPISERKGSPIQVNPILPEEKIQTKVVEYVQSEGGVSLGDASVIVSGGRGLSNNPNLTPPPGMDDKQAEIWRAQQGFKLIAELAEALGGAIGASRAAVDAGYIPYPYQVGQTGKVVSPDLYIACGISGAIQHLAGMRSSKIIVAINKDPDAPIFKLARFGVVGDLYTILPALAEAFRHRLEK